MPTINNFEDLDVWKLARQQCRDIDFILNTTSLSKDWELRNQINGSSGSVMDNIAEGFERSGNKEFVYFMVIAKGSNGEVRSQLYRCLDREYITKEKFEDLLKKNLNISGKIGAFIKYLKSSEFKGNRYK